MSHRFKKILSFMFAFLVGTGIIFFAWNTGEQKKEEFFFEPTISDSSWKNSLIGTYVENPQKEKTVGDTKEELPSTTTDIIARNLLVNYAILQQNSATTTISDTDAEALANALIKGIPTPKTATYTTKDLNLSSDNSEAALSVYAEKINTAIQSFLSAHTISELDVIGDALTSKESAGLEKLSVIAAQYNTLHKKLLAIPTPSTIAPLHLRLVQAYANIATSVEGMKGMLSDPILGLSILAQYKDEFNSLDKLSIEYREYTVAH